MAEWRHTHYQGSWVQAQGKFHEQQINVSSLFIFVSVSESLIKEKGEKGQVVMYVVEHTDYNEQGPRFKSPISPAGGEIHKQ